MRILTESCANTRIFVRWVELKWVETKCCYSPKEIAVVIILLRDIGVRIAELLTRMTTVINKCIFHFSILFDATIFVI